MPNSRVFITGFGLVCPLGYDNAPILDRLRTQQHGFCRLPEFADFKTSQVSIGTTIDGFDCSSFYPEDWIAPTPHGLKKETLRGFNPHSFYALYATRAALAQAGLTDAIANDRAGLYTASAGSVRNLRRNLDTMYQYGIQRTSPFGIINSIVGTLSYNLAPVFGITGETCGFASACASSAHALGYAFDSIALGRQDRIIVVGAEDGDLDSVLPFAGMHALSTASDPDSACLPFDQRRSGFVGAGGAATIILESEESLQRRGASPLAEMLGWGQSGDGYNPAIPRPDGVGVARAMRLALKQAALAPEEIGYINAHATGTQVGDVAEAKAIREVFGDSPAVPVSSTKALTGHTLSMAGALEVGLTLLAWHDGFTPGTANLTEVDPECEGLHLPRQNLARSSGPILSNSSGFGGANVSLAFCPVG